MKIFEASGSVDTTDKTAVITLVFQDTVQYVALSEFLNDHQITYHFNFVNIDGKTWQAQVTRTDQQVRWIPALKVLGFQM